MVLLKRLEKENLVPSETMLVKFAISLIIRQQEAIKVLLSSLICLAKIPKHEKNTWKIITQIENLEMEVVYLLDLFKKVK